MVYGDGGDWKINHDNRQCNQLDLSERLETSY